MNYKNKKVAITGIGNGFIADQLARRLSGLGAEVWDLEGDIRDPKTFDDINYTFDYLFHFAAPSSQIQFKKKPQYCVDVTINGFINAVNACREHGVKLIYPSTGLLSSGDTNEYARCKKLCEDIAIGSKLDALGVRIFASYGHSEGHKRDYASVPYLFIRDMVKGKRPIIYGDGNQKRDFIHITDVTESLAILAEECNEQIIDVGSGVSKSFNEIIEVTNEILFGADQAKWVRPVYVDKPGGYVDETHADIEKLNEYYKPEVSLYMGIKDIVEALQHDRGKEAKT